MPWLTDAYGLYYNTDMFEAAGITEPPTTTDELFEAAKKLTVFNPDGSIKVAGFVPYIGTYYSGNTMSPFATMYGVDWYNDDGTTAVNTYPRGVPWPTGRSSSSTTTGTGTCRSSSPARAMSGARRTISRRDVSP